MRNCSNAVGFCGVFCCCFKEILIEDLLYAENCLCAEFGHYGWGFNGAIGKEHCKEQLPNYVTVAISFAHKDSWKQIDHAVISIDC